MLYIQTDYIADLLGKKGIQKIVFHIPCLSCQQRQKRTNQIMIDLFQSNCTLSNSTEMIGKKIRVQCQNYANA